MSRDLKLEDKRRKDGIRWKRWYEKHRAEYNKRRRVAHQLHRQGLLERSNVKSPRDTPPDSPTYHSLVLPQPPQGMAPTLDLSYPYGERHVGNAAVPITIAWWRVVRSIHDDAIGLGCTTH